MDAYLTGLEQAREAGRDLAQIHSVASFFVSRVDTEVDKRLDAIGTDDALALSGKAAVANALLAYGAYEEVLPPTAGRHWPPQGANPQRPLWASTGVKNPDYPDTMYVTDLVVAGHRQHHAGEDDGGLRRPRRGPRRPGHRQGLRGSRHPRPARRGRRRLPRRAGRPSSTKASTSSRSRGPSWSRRSRARWRRPVSDRLEHRLRGGPVRALLRLPRRDGVRRRGGALVDDKFASRLAARDATLWGDEAEAEAAKRLAWVDLHSTSRPLVDEIDELRANLQGQGLNRIVLCGMGGSSLAPEVICAADGVDLVVLDSSDPDFVRAALEDHLDRTVVVVSSKSGGTVETDSQRRAFEKAFTDAGIDPKSRIVVVTDPGSPLDASATEAGYRVFRADPDVGGRYSALTAFGLVPSGLAGADVSPPARRGRGHVGGARRRLRRQPGAPARRAARRRQPGRRRQARAGRRRLVVRRAWRLGRAARRGVHGQGRQGHPAGRGRGQGRPQLLPQHRRRGARRRTGPTARPSCRPPAGA